jgi:hypothetical protein
MHVCMFALYIYTIHGVLMYCNYVHDADTDKLQCNATQTRFAHTRLVGHDSEMALSELKCNKRVLFLLSS